MIPDSRPNIPGLLRVASPSTCNTQQNRVSGNATRNRDATGAQQTSLKALALLALSRNSHATATQQEAQKGQKTTQQTVAIDRGFVAQEPSLLRVARVAFPRGATAQQVTRTVVKFRLRGGCQRSWCAAIGTRSRQEIIAELVQKHGDAVEVLP